MSREDRIRSKVIQLAAAVDQDLDLDRAEDGGVRLELPGGATFPPEGVLAPGELEIVLNHLLAMRAMIDLRWRLVREQSAMYLVAFDGFVRAMVAFLGQRALRIDEGDSETGEPEGAGEAWSIPDPGVIHGHAPGTIVQTEGEGWVEILARSPGARVLVRTLTETPVRCLNLPGDIAVLDHTLASRPELFARIDRGLKRLVRALRTAPSARAAGQVEVPRALLEEILDALVIGWAELRG